MKITTLNGFALIASMLIIASCNSPKQPGTSDGSYSKIFFTGMDNPDSLAKVSNSNWKNMSTLVETSAHSGKYCSKIDSVNQFSFLFESAFSLIEHKVPKQVKVSAYCYGLQPESKARLVVSVKGDKYYKAYVADSLFVTPGEWHKIESTYNLPDKLDIYDVVKVYAMNNKTGELLVDDLRIEFIYPPAEK
jgi:hypothetical protein